MPSEQRLHPASLVFAFARSLKAFALPGLLAALSLNRASSPWRPTFGSYQPPDTWQLWLMLLIIPSVLAAVARYLSFRLRYDESELVIRSGILVRNERHVPYHRIQNLDAVQNVFHRALGVIEVRVDTGASKEPEATISVLPESAFHEMRRRVFAGRIAAQGADAVVPGVVAADAGRTLLRLPLRELLLCGFLENRGLVIVGAIYGLLWESGLLGALWQGVFENQAYAPGMVRGMVRSIADGGGLPLGQIAVIASGVVLLLLLVRLLSMAWALARLYGFHLSRVGDDLRTEFGLLTRVSTTIPVRRVQSVTIGQAPLYRFCSRVTVRVETAGGGGHGAQPQATRQRELLAPLIHPRDLPGLLGEVLPGIDVNAIDWQPPHPRAFRRAVKPAIGLGLVLSAAATLVMHWTFVFATPLFVAWMIYATYRQIRRLGWTATDEWVAFRSGWLWRSATIVPVSRIQAVRCLETPFDRLTAMARVRVDTAGASERSHRVDIPYLARDTALALHHRLAASAQGSAFRW